MIAFFVVGVYRGVWRHFGMMDALVVAKGVFFGTLSAQLFILYVYRFFCVLAHGVRDLRACCC